MCFACLCMSLCVSVCVMRRPVSIFMNWPFPPSHHHHHHCHRNHHCRRHPRIKKNPTAVTKIAADLRTIPHIELPNDKPLRPLDTIERQLKSRLDANRFRPVTAATCSISHNSHNSKTSQNSQRICDEAQIHHAADDGPDATLSTTNLDRLNATHTNNNTDDVPEINTESALDTFASMSVDCSSSICTDDGNDLDELDALATLESYEQAIAPRFHSSLRQIVPSSQKQLTTDSSIFRSISHHELAVSPLKRIPYTIRKTAYADFYDLIGVDLESDRAEGGHRHHTKRCPHLDCSTWHLSELNNDRRRATDDFVLVRLMRRMRKLSMIGWKRMKIKAKVKRGDYTHTQNQQQPKKN